MRLDFGVWPDAVKLNVQPDGNRRAELDVRAVAYDDAGKPLNMTGERGSLKLTPEAFQEAQKSGIHFHE